MIEIFTGDDLIQINTDRENFYLTNWQRDMCITEIFFYF